LERRLRFAMVASVGGRRPAVSTEQVAAALRWRGIPATVFSVHSHAPEDFLIVLESAELRRHVAGLPSVLVAGTPLVLRPWNRQVQAKQVPLRSRVFLVLEGIPPHAWDVGRGRGGRSAWQVVRRGGSGAGDVLAGASFVVQVDGLDVAAGRHPGGTHTRGAGATARVGEAAAACEGAPGGRGDTGATSGSFDGCLSDSNIAIPCVDPSGCG
jgi:hypothetical protein